MGIRYEVARYEDPPFAKVLFASPAFAWTWLLLRVWLGYQWISAAEHKIFEPGWMETGGSLQKYWQNALGAGSGAKSTIVFDWYAGFLQIMLNGGYYVWFAKLVAIGELAIGAALVIGLFTGIAALFGGFMNWNFMMAGTASTNPMLFAIAVALVLAWKVAGYWGVDRVLLPALGTPWAPGVVFGKRSLGPGIASGRAAEHSA